MKIFQAVNDTAETGEITEVLILAETVEKALVKLGDLLAAGGGRVGLDRFWLNEIPTHQERYLSIKHAPEEAVTTW